MRPLISMVLLSLLGSAALADDTPAAPAPGAAETPQPNPTPPQPAGASPADVKPADTKPTDPGTGVASGPAEAGSLVPTPSKQLSTIVRTSLPEKCRVHGRFANSYVRPIAVSSRLALAQCLVVPSLEPVKSLLDTQESMLTLENAVSQSLQLFDEVIAFGDPAKQVLAAHAKGELYENLLVRMANTVPHPTSGGGALALYESRKTLLDAMLQPWRDQAAAAFQRAAAIAGANPKLAASSAVQSAVAKSQQRVQLHTATSAAKQTATANPPTTQAGATTPAGTPGASAPAAATPTSAATAPAPATTP